MADFISSALSFASDVTSLFTGGALIILGNFSFQDFEVPEFVSLGGKQSLTVHRMPGGARVIDSMGSDDKSISWHGILLGPQASSRAALLDQMRKQGISLPLTFGGYHFNVVIENLDLSYRANHYTYDLSCVVVSTGTPPASSSLLGSLTDDLSSALGVNIPAALSTVTSAIQTVTPALNAVVGLTGASPAALGVLGVVNSAGSVVSGLSSAANGSIASLTSSLVGFTGGASKAVNILNSLGTAVSNAPSLNQIGNFLGRMGNNLSKIGTG